MISVVRVRAITNQDANTVWSDQLMTNWLAPLRMYSLANFWMVSGRGLLPLDFSLYPPVVSTATAPSTVAGRTDFEVTVAAEATLQVAPDWDATDVLLLWFAQPTGWWGGGSIDVRKRNGKTKPVAVTVVDHRTPFDAACQELGHSFGFGHEVLEDSMDEALKAGGHVYASPYSVMSSRRYGYGGDNPSFLRPSDPALPEGSANPEAPFLTYPANRVVGPRLTLAQLLSNTTFASSSAVVAIGQGYLPHGRVARVHAANYRLPQSGLPVLLSLVSGSGDGRIFTVELRRGGWDYDQRLGSSNAPPEGLVVHSVNGDGSIRYEGVAP
jgi:hypothetical protein